MTGAAPLVSVILPTYNRAHTLLRAINSVLNQDYREIELIVVDDASTDGSAKLLASIADPRLRVIRHAHNKGVAGATNTGIQAARGKFIAFQDSDDEWLDGKLSQQMARLAAAQPDCVCVYCIKIVYGRDPEFRRGRRRVACVPGPEEALVEGDLRALLWRRNIVSPQTAICTRATALQLGGFDEKLRSDQDWDFFSQLAEIGSFAFVDAPLVSTYLQTDSISANARKSQYSQFIVTNKMKRRGVPRAVLAEHWARLGYHIGRRRGAARRGATLLRAALAARPLHARTWARYLRIRLGW
jgi:glycosyltransferase involved in cell wall biosynthesis